MKFGGLLMKSDRAGRVQFQNFHSFQRGKKKTTGKCENEHFQALHKHSTTGRTR